MPQAAPDVPTGPRSNHYEALVIGSGAAGMLAACLLARAGRRVLVLERHSRLGGLMQTYKRRGVRFPTGVHALGALAPGQVLERLWRYAGVLARLALTPMDREAAIAVRFGDGSQFAFPWGRERLRERLRAACPGEQTAIDGFLTTLARTVGHFPLYNLRSGPEAPTPAMEQPLASFLRDLGASPRLRAILSAVHPFYGVDPERCPLYVHCLVLDSFLQSAWRVDELQTPLAAAFAASIEAWGGALRTGSAVVRIRCSQGRVTEVELADGERLATPLVLFSGHPRQLARLCTEKGGLRPTFRRRLAGAEDAPSFFGIGWAWPEQSCPWARQDVFLYPGPLDGCYARSFPRQAPGLVYGSAACGARRGSLAAVAMCPTPWEPWQDFDGSLTGRREAAYEELKQRGAQRLRGLLAEVWPELAGLQVLDIFTPLTYRDYTWTPRGSAYGLSKATDNLRAGRLSPVTRVQGLYLIGQSVVLPGILGSSISSLAACAAILGRDALLAGILADG